MQNKNTKILGLVIAGISLALVLTIGLTDNVSASSPIYCESGVTCYGTNGDDHIIGTSGADTIFGKGGDDLIQGQGGNDLIHGDGCINTGCEGADTIYGGAGNDIIHHDGSQNWHNQQDYNVDSIHCGGGTNDVVHYKPTGDNDVLLGTHGCEWQITANQ